MSSPIYSQLQNTDLKIIPKRNIFSPIRTFYHSIQLTLDKNIHDWTILYKRYPPTKKIFLYKTNIIPQNNNEKLGFDNPTQTVEFRLQGLQIVAFVLVLVSDRLGEPLSSFGPLSSL